MNGLIALVQGILEQRIENLTASAEIPEADIPNILKQYDELSELCKLLPTMEPATSKIASLKTALQDLD